MRIAIAKLYQLLRSNPKQTYAYCSAIFITTLALYINLLSIFVFLNLPTNRINVVILENKKLQDWANTILVFTPLLLVVFASFPKKLLDKFEFNNNELKRAKAFFLIYIVGTILLLLIAGYIKAKRGY